METYMLFLTFFFFLSSFPLSLSQDNSRALQEEALGQVFRVQYSLEESCGKCLDSHGRCGSNDTSPFICHCRDGDHPLYCPDPSNKEYRECQPTRCGKVEEIDYPFWSETSRPHYCGRPEFQLYCPLDEDHYPLIKFDSQTFNVTQLDLFTHEMTLVRTDFDNCSSHLTNTSVSMPLYLQYDEPYLMNVTLFYGCPVDYSAGGMKFACRPGTSSDSNSNIYAAYAEDEWNGTQFHDLVKNCKHHIQVPVSVETDSEALQEALGRGFHVQYNVDESCQNCVNSDGVCGSNDKSAFTCYCLDGHHPLNCSYYSSDSSNSSGHSWKAKLIIGVGGATGLLLLCITICCCNIKSWMRRIGLCKTSTVDQNIEAFIKIHGPLALTRYKYEDIKKMTNSFKDKLGQGGFGSVYKGKLLNGRPVAVKLLKASKENGEDFINEVASISRTSNINIVNLLGFCFEGKKKALIYEFMSNGSLDKFIHNNVNKNGLCLTWENLYQIAIGIARGLEYLHKGCTTRILHFDIKPHNILLDDNFCPKISDFGLAKLCLQKGSIISISEARGTIGYLAPEIWNRNIGGVSHKSDVYSYGMMLLDMVGGRKNINVEANRSTDQYFPHYIYVQLEQDSSLECNGANNMEENDIARRMTIVSLWCIQTFPSQRPTMSKVIEMLERSPDLLEMPPKPVMPSPPRLELESSTTTNTTTGILGFQSSAHMLLEEH